MKYITILLLFISSLAFGQLPNATFKVTKAGDGTYELVTSMQVDTSEASLDAMGGIIKSQITVSTFADSADAASKMFDALSKIGDQISELEQKQIALKKEQSILLREFNSTFGSNSYERTWYRILGPNIGPTCTVRENGQRVGVYDIDKPNNTNTWNFNLRECTTSRGRLIITSITTAELRNYNSVKSIPLYGKIVQRENAQPILVYYGTYLNTQGQPVNLKLICTAVTPTQNTAQSPPPLVVPGPRQQ